METQTVGSPSRTEQFQQIYVYRATFGNALASAWLNLLDNRPSNGKLAHQLIDRVQTIISRCLIRQSALRVSQMTEKKEEEITNFDGLKIFKNLSCAGVERS